jgi:hypothetical protein
VFNGNTYAGADFTDTTFVDSITGTGTDIVSGPNFMSPEEFNYTTDGHNRNSLVEIKPLELLRINVQTTPPTVTETFTLDGTTTSFTLAQNQSWFNSSDVTIHHLNGVNANTEPGWKVSVPRAPSTDVIDWFAGVVGFDYEIVDNGTGSGLPTDFTAIGAADNNVGTVFTLTNTTWQGPGGSGGRVKLVSGGWSISGQVITFTTPITLHPTSGLTETIEVTIPGNSGLTFAHIQDYSGYVNAYALTEAKETTIATTPLTLDSTTITVASTAAFSSVGIAYVNGELIEYVVADATTLGITKRELAGTFKVQASIGDSITDVTNSKLTFANEDPSHYQYNDLGDTILNSPGSTQAQELQTLGKGIEL